MMQIWQRGGNAYQAEVQDLVLGFLNETNVLPRIASNDAQDLATLHRQMTPALNLALALHYACSGASLFQQQIAAMLGAAEQQKSD